MKRHILVSLTADLVDARVGESLGIRYIKSFLNENGHEVDILENQFQRLNAEELANTLENYDVIGFSINYCGQIAILREVLNCINTFHKLIYLGGHFATISYKVLIEDFPAINFVMLSDGEYSTLELVQNNFNYKNISNIAYRENGTVTCTPLILVDQLDQLPFPYRDHNSYYLGDAHFSVISSRGCYNNCSYCSVGSFTKSFFNHRIRFRSAQNIYEEIRVLKDTHHVEYLTFQDDLFVGADSESQRRAKELSRIIIENQIDIFFSIQCSVKAVNFDTFSALYKAGLRNVMIGIENFSEHALRCFSKPQNLSDIETAIKTLHEIGIPISYGFIMYYPEMEPKEILENIEILYRLGIINLRSITSKLQIYMGTPYFERRLEDFIVAERTNYTIKYQFKNPEICTFIVECKAFAKTYGQIENKLRRLEFLSHSNPRIDVNAVEKLSSEYRDCIYHYSKTMYNEVFEKTCNNHADTIKKRMIALEKAVCGLYHKIWQN